MINLIKRPGLSFSRLLPVLLFFLATGRIVAQDDGGGNVPSEIDVDVDMGADSEVWYTNWWIWIIGLAVFIIIIVAIVSAGKNRA